MTSTPTRVVILGAAGRDFHNFNAVYHDDERVEVVAFDPRPWARGSIREIFAGYPALGPVLPAMGYDTAQRADLEATINAVPCDTVLLGTPMDLRRGLTLPHPVTRARYEMEEAGPLSLDEVLEGL